MTLTALRPSLSETHSMIDRAAKWGIIKKNAAARYKSRLTANVRKLYRSRRLSFSQLVPGQISPSQCDRPVARRGELCRSR